MLLNKIDRYIFKTVFSSFLIVVAIFCVLFFIFTYLAQVSNAGPDTGTWDVVILTLFQMPGILYILLPVCAMVGALMGLSLLANNSEIIVLRSSGRSTAQISKGVVAVGLIGAITTIVFGGYIAPALQKQVETNKVAYNTHNIWIKTPSGIMNIGNINATEKTAKRITKFDIDGSKLKEVRYAKYAKYSSDKSATSYQISNIIYPTKDNQKKISINTYIKSAKWNDPLPISLAKLITVNDNDYLNLTQLTKFMLSDSTASNQGLSLKFWQEVFQPISVMVLVLLSVPLSIGSTRSSALIIKLLLGAIFGFAFFIINQIFGPIALILHLPPIIGAAAPTIIAFVLLIILFIKSKES